MTGRTLSTRIAAIEAQALTRAASLMVARPPREDREAWLARRAAGLRWDRDTDGTGWVLVPESGR